MSNFGKNKLSVSFQDLLVLIAIALINQACFAIAERNYDGSSAATASGDGPDVDSINTTSSGENATDDSDDDDSTPPTFGAGNTCYFGNVEVPCQAHASALVNRGQNSNATTFAVQTHDAMIAMSSTEDTDGYCVKTNPVGNGAATQFVLPSTDIGTGVVTSAGASLTYGNLGFGWDTYFSALAAGNLAGNKYSISFSNPTSMFTDGQSFDFPTVPGSLSDVQVNGATLNENSTNLVLDKSDGIDITWTPDATTNDGFVTIELEDPGAANTVMCVVPDNGSYTISSSDLSSMPTFAAVQSGSLNVTKAVVSAEVISADNETYMVLAAWNYGLAFRPQGTASLALQD